MNGQTGFRIGNKRTRATDDKKFWKSMIANVMKHGIQKKEWGINFLSYPISSCFRDCTLLIISSPFLCLLSSIVITITSLHHKTVVPFTYTHILFVFCFKLFWTLYPREFLCAFFLFFVFCNDTVQSDSCYYHSHWEKNWIVIKLRK